MIALCTQHASAADRNLYPRSQLRQLKASARAAEEIRALLPWSPRDFLVRLGGNYSGGEMVPLQLGGTPIVSLSRDPNGLLLLSLELNLPNGTCLARVVENVFEADPGHLHDLSLNTAPTLVKLWFSRRDIGIELSFRRITLGELDDILRKDWGRANQKKEQCLLGLPPDVKALIERMRSLPPEPMPGTLSGSDLPIHIREAFLSGDPTGSLVRDYANRQLDDQGKVAFLDFRKLRIHSNGKEAIVWDGLAAGGTSIAYSAAFDNKLGGFNL